MFNIGIGELLFIAILILVFIGPERLPKIMRQLGEYTAQVRTIIRNFNQEFAEELRPLHEIRSLADELNPTAQLGNLIDPDVQRPAPKQTPAAPRTTNPMSQLGGQPSTTAPPAVGQPTIAPPHAPGERPPNPVAQIAQDGCSPGRGYGRFATGSVRQRGV
ncbi:MAG TPA: twin-arginine translocase subunit TatB [Caldilineae bacterium]|nr:twin-arginine translocase subunit TatB [Caldilineae bacterium]